MAEDLIPWAERLSAVLQEAPATVGKALAGLRAPLEARARSGAPGGSGALRRSIQAKLAGQGADSSLSVSMPAKYAPVEFGGTVRAKRSRFLAVPISPSARSVAGPRADGALFVVSMQDGRRFLARKGVGIELRWRLVESVTHRAHRFLGAAFDEAAVKAPQSILAGLKEAALG